MGSLGSLLPRLCCPPPRSPLSLSLSVIVLPRVKPAPQPRQQREMLSLVVIVDQIMSVISWKLVVASFVAYLAILFVNKLRSTGLASSSTTAPTPARKKRVLNYEKKESYTR